MIRSFKVEVLIYIYICIEALIRVYRRRVHVRSMICLRWKEKGKDEGGYMTAK